MFDTFSSNRLPQERDGWLRTQKQGKSTFILRSTLSIGGAAFLFSSLICRHYLHGTCHVPAVAGLILLSMALGYLVSELTWRRGSRFTKESI